MELNIMDFIAISAIVLVSVVVFTVSIYVMYNMFLTGRFFHFV